MVQHMSILLVILMYATWSGVFAIGKLTLAYAPPLFLTGSRMAIAGVLLLGFLALRKKLSFRLTKAQYLSIGALAFFSIYLTNILEFWGLQYLPSGKACFIYSLSPLFAAFFSYLHFGERMSPIKWLGISVSLIGILPVLLQQTSGEELLQATSFLSWPTLAIIGAALASIYGWVLLRLIVKDQETSPVLANGMSMLLGGAFALTHSFFVDPWNPLPIAEGGTAPFLQGTMVMVFLFNILCYNCYGILLKRFTATFLSLMGLLSPIFASLNGFLFLGEPISPLIFISTAIVSIGLWIVYRAELKQGYTQTT